MATFRCSIVTPTSSPFDGEVEYVSMPAWDGQQGVMNGQSPLLTRLGIGPLRLDLPGGQSRSYLVDGGFAQVTGTHLTLLTDAATPAEELTREEAEQELNTARERAMSAAEDQDEVQHQQQRAYVKRSLARR